MSEGKAKELPEGWELALVGDVLEVIRGVTYRKEDSSKAEVAGFVPILRATNIQEKVTFEDLVYVPASVVSKIQRVQQGDVIVAASSGSASLVGKGAQLRHEWSGSFGAFCFVLRPEALVESRFLGWFVQTKEYRNRVSNASAGVNINNIRAEHIESTPLRFPPLSEQTRIADKLDELLSDLDAAVATLERVRSKIKPYRAAVLKAAVEGNLTAAWRSENPATEPAADLLTRILVERRKRWEETQLRKFQEQGRTPPKDWKAKYKEPAAPDTAKLPELPEGWCWASIDELTVEIRNGYSSKPDASEGVPILRISSVRPFALDLSDRRFLSGTADEYRTDQIAAGDLLFTRYNGSRNLVGVCAVVPDIDEEIVHPDKLIRARPVPSVSNSRFFGLAANVGHSRKYIEQRIRTTAGQAGVSGSDVKTLPIPLPPLAEQAAIVEAVEDQLSVIDHLEADLEAKLKSAQALRQAILRDAFEGKLVPQDPNDEPAAELLQRIAAARAERAAAAKAAKTPPKKASPPRNTRKPSRK